MNQPIGIPSGWEIVAAFYWGGDTEVLATEKAWNISTDMNASNWADYCDPKDQNDWSVEP